jgi:hypothetical protein
MKAKTAPSIYFEEQGSTRAILLMLLVLTIGFAGGALVVYRMTASKKPTPVAENELTLSESTRAVLSQLKAPVEVRFFALFGGDVAATNLQEFALEIGNLLSAMETEAQGKITVTRHVTWTPETTKLAAADGIVPVDVGGDPSYVGLVVAQDKRKESLARLAPEWASALEFDLARAISRVGTPPSAPQTPAQIVESSQAEVSVKRTIPDAAATSLEDGKQILREASLKAYQDLVNEMNREVAKAEQAVQQSSEADREAASQRLQQVRANYVENLRNVALQSQAQMESWTKLKGR